MDRCNARDWFWLIVVMALSSVWCVTAGHRLGATFDEPVYLQRGLDGWRTHSHRGLLRLGTMPLPADVQTLPLYLSELLTGREWNLETDFASALGIARITNLLFWWLLLAYGWRGGRMIGGVWAGNLAVAVLAVEPNLLAHASLATTDVALTGCLLAFLVHYMAGRGGSAWRRIVVPGLWFGIALAAKASALVFVPLCILSIEFRDLVTGKVDWRHRVRESAQIGSLGLLVVTLFCGSDWQPEPSFVAWANGLAEGPARSAAVWFADHFCIFSNAFEGLARQVKHNLHGHGVYLLGSDNEHSIWYYFPVLFSIKLTIPLLLASLLLTVLRPRALANWAGFAAIALVLFSFNCRVQIGIRLVLPCVALGTVAIAAASATVLQNQQAEIARRIARLGATAGVAWMAVNSLTVWPDGLRFINELWGGPTEGYRLVSDSNYDWGQGLPELARWQAEHQMDVLNVWYFGTDPQLLDDNFHSVALHGLPIESPHDVAHYVAGRYLAVGTTLLYGHGLTESHRRAAEYLRGCRPVARTSTFLIFDFTSSNREVARSGGASR